MTDDGYYSTPAPLRRISTLWVIPWFRDDQSMPEAYTLHSSGKQTEKFLRTCELEGCRHLDYSISYISAVQIIPATEHDFYETAPLVVCEGYRGRHELHVRGAAVVQTSSSAILQNLKSRTTKDRGGFKVETNPKDPTHPMARGVQETLLRNGFFDGIIPPPRELIVDLAERRKLAAMQHNKTSG